MNTQREIRRQRQNLPPTSFLVNAARASLIWCTQYARHPPLEKLASALSTCSSNQLCLPLSTIIHHLEYISIHIESSNSWNPKIRSPKDRRVVYLALSLYIYISLLPSRGSPRYFLFFSHWKAAASPVPFSGLLLSVSPPGTPLFVPEHEQLVKGEIVNISRPWPTGWECAQWGNSVIGFSKRYLPKITNLKG